MSKKKKSHLPSQKDTPSSVYNLALFGRPGSGKSTLINAIRSLDRYEVVHDIFSFVPEPKKKYIFEGTTLDELKTAKQKGFKTVFVHPSFEERQETDFFLTHPHQRETLFSIQNQCEYFFENRRFRSSEERTNIIKRFLGDVVETSFFIEKTYASPQKSNKKREVTRFFFATFHAIIQFKRRLSLLTQKINAKQYHSQIASNCLYFYSRHKEGGTYRIFKEAFRKARKVDPSQGYYRYQSRRHDYKETSEYFSDGLFVFVVQNDIIVTAELVPADETLKAINKQTSASLRK